MRAFTAIINVSSDIIDFVETLLSIKYYINGFYRAVYAFVRERILTWHNNVPYSMNCKEFSYKYDHNPLQVYPTCSHVFACFHSLKNSKLNLQIVRQQADSECSMKSFKWKIQITTCFVVVNMKIEYSRHIHSWHYETHEMLWKWIELTEKPKEMKRINWCDSEEWLVDDIINNEIIVQKLPTEKKKQKQSNEHEYTMGHHVCVWSLFMGLWRNHLINQTHGKTGWIEMLKLKYLNFYHAHTTETLLRLFKRRLKWPRCQ